jgi:hypothetical protein
MPERHPLEPHAIKIKDAVEQTVVSRPTPATEVALARVVMRQFSFLLCKREAYGRA